MRRVRGRAEGEKGKSAKLQASLGSHASHAWGKASTGGTSAGPLHAYSSPPCIVPSYRIHPGQAKPTLLPPPGRDRHRLGRAVRKERGLALIGKAKVVATRSGGGARGILEQAQHGCVCEPASWSAQGRFNFLATRPYARRMAGEGPPRRAASPRAVSVGREGWTKARITCRIREVAPDKRRPARTRSRLDPPIQKVASPGISCQDLGGTV